MFEIDEIRTQAAKRSGGGPGGQFERVAAGTAIDQAVEPRGRSEGQPIVTAAELDSGTAGAGNQPGVDDGGVAAAAYDTEAARHHGARIHPDRTRKRHVDADAGSS